MLFDCVTGRSRITVTRLGLDSLSVSEHSRKFNLLIRKSEIETLNLDFYSFHSLFSFCLKTTLKEASAVFVVYAKLKDLLPLVKPAIVLPFNETSSTYEFVFDLEVILIS